MAGCTNEDTPIFYWGTEITQSLLGCLCITWFKFRISSVDFLLLVSSSCSAACTCSSVLFLFLLRVSSCCSVARTASSPRLFFLLRVSSCCSVARTASSPRLFFLLRVSSCCSVARTASSPRLFFLLSVSSCCSVARTASSPRLFFLLRVSSCCSVARTASSPRFLFLLRVSSCCSVARTSSSPRFLFLLSVSSCCSVARTSSSPRFLFLLRVSSCCSCNLYAVFSRDFLFRRPAGVIPFVLLFLNLLVDFVSFDTWNPVLAACFSLCFASLWLWSAKYFVKITIGQSVGKRDALFNVDGMAASTGPICMRGWWHELLLASSSPTASCNRLDFLLGAELASTLHDLLSTPFLSLLTSRGWVSPVVTWTLDGCLLVFFLSLSDSRLDVALSSALCDLPLASLPLCAFSSSLIFVATSPLGATLCVSFLFLSAVLLLAFLLCGLLSALFFSVLDSWNPNECLNEHS